jgi:hypothetical protein
MKGERQIFLHRCNKGRLISFHLSIRPIGTPAPEILKPIIASKLCFLRQGPCFLEYALDEAPLSTTAINQQLSVVTQNWHWCCVQAQQDPVFWDEFDFLCVNSWIAWELKCVLLE